MSPLRQPLARYLLLLFYSNKQTKCQLIMRQVYRGKLIEAEDNMNSQMASVTVTYRDGRVAQLENIYIRGSKIRFMILPDMLKNAPMFKNMMTRFDPILDTAGNLWLISILQGSRWSTKGQVRDLEGTGRSRGQG